LRIVRCLLSSEVSSFVLFPRSCRCQSPFSGLFGTFSSSSNNLQDDHWSQKREQRLVFNWCYGTTPPEIWKRQLLTYDSYGIDSIKRFSGL
jgi:hypothetical protein